MSRNQKGTAFFHTALLSCLFAGAVFLLSPSFCSAQSGHTYANPDTNYSAIVTDDANLLTSDEEDALLDDMKPLTEHGNILLCTTTNSGSMSTSEYAQKTYQNTFGSNSDGSALAIDMQNRNIWIFSTGHSYDIITSSYADTITDNAYSYASNEQYYKCASVCFAQMYTLFSGQKIAQPMKYICNAFLALLLSLFLNYLFVKWMSSRYKAKTAPAEDFLEGTFYVTDPVIQVTGTSQTSAPEYPDFGADGYDTGDSNDSTHKESDHGRYRTHFRSSAGRRSSSSRGHSSSHHGSGGHHRRSGGGGHRF